MSEQIAVVGAGQMGNGIAQDIAQSGLPVTMLDVPSDALEKGMATIEKNLDRQVKKGTINEKQREETLGYISPETDIEAAKHSRADSHQQADAPIGERLNTNEQVASNSSAVVCQAHHSGPTLRRASGARCSAAPRAMGGSRVVSRDPN